MLSVRSLPLLQAILTDMNDTVRTIADYQDAEQRQTEGRTKQRIEELAAELEALRTTNSRLTDQVDELERLKEDFASAQAKSASNGKGTVRRGGDNPNRRPADHVKAAVCEH